MSSQRYIVFVRPPTIEQLRKPPNNIIWETKKCFIDEENLSSSTIHHQESNNSFKDKQTSISESTDQINTLSKKNSDDQLHSSKRVKIDQNDKSITHSQSNVNSNDEMDLDCFQTQLDYHDSFTHDSGDITLMTASQGISCLLSNNTQNSISSSKNSSSQSSFDQNLISQQTSYSESMVVNPPQWHFDSRSCTSLDHLSQSYGKLFNILFYLAQKTPMINIELKKNRKNGLSNANLAHFDCIDDSGSCIKLALWDEVAESLDSACLVGDIIYLSGVAISSYKGKLQASSTLGSRAQICYRLKPTHQSHLQMFCPDMRLGYDPTTHRVKELIQWIKQIYF